MEGNITLHYREPVLSGSIKVPGDKSISHRAVMLGSMAEGITKIDGFLEGEDCLRTIEIFKQLGAAIEHDGERVTVESKGMENWSMPSGNLYAGNSGTTARLLLGILSASSVVSVLTGDDSLTNRPMKRVTDPLRRMGAKIEGGKDDNYLPLTIAGTQLSGIEFEMEVASAQVKSAVLFAGLYAEGSTTVIEKAVSRDHTERMLKQFGADIVIHEKTVTVKNGKPLTATDVFVPGDISSAAFFMAAAAICRGSSVTLTETGLNPTRTGMIEVMKRMGADITITETDNVQSEPYGTIHVNHSALRGVEIGGDLIPALIDEIPVIALMATQAEGMTVIKDAEELRVKETDRIAAVTAELKKMGADIEATADGMIIKGPTPLKGASLSSYGDHRLGMMAAVGALIADGPVEIDDASCIAISYPTFFDHINKLTGIKTK